MRKLVYPVILQLDVDATTNKRLGERKKRSLKYDGNGYC
jgi:hypothetical protein